MATYTSTSGNYKTTLTVTETSTSIPNNTSTLSWSLKVERIGGASQYGIHNANQCPWSVSINGSRVGSGTFSYDFRYTGSYNLGSGNNVTVAHNNDGTKTGVAVSGTVDLDNSAYVSVMTASGTIDLTTIPRASDISLSVGSYNVTSSSGNAFTYTITAKSTSFYNRLRYTLGSTNYTGSGSTGSRSGNFTNAELLTSLPTATSGSLTAYVDTATDSGFTNIIGTNSVSIPISINTSYIKPSLTLQNLSVNNSPISGYAVAGYSKVQCGTSSSKWSASGGYGSNAITVTFTTSHGSLAQSSYSASSNSISNYTVTNVLPSSSSNYTLTISATARDSRGATTSASKTYTVYGYTPPTANLTAYRVASSSSTTEDGAGTYAYVTFSGAVSASVNGQNSVQIISCSYWGAFSGQASNGQHIALSDTQSLTFQLSVTDKVSSTTIQKTVNTAAYPLDLCDDGNGNVGVGIGTVAQSNSFRLGDKVWVGSNLNITGENKILWKEGGYAGSWPDSFAVSPHFTGSGDSNYLNIQGCVGEQGETPALNDFIHIYGQSGTISSILGNIWSGFSTASRECDIGASSVAGSIYFHSNGNQGTSGFRGIYGQNGSGTGQEVLLVGPDNEVRLGYHASFRCINTNTDTFTFYALPNLTNTSIFKYAIIYGGGSTTYFAYFVFFSTDNISTFVPILFSSQSRTFTTTVDGNYLTFKANGTCWGGIRLIWIN